MNDEFVMLNAFDANLRLRNHLYNNYLIVQHDATSEDVKNQIIRLKQIADCFPVLPNNHLAYRHFDDSLDVKLANTTFIANVHLHQDITRHLLRNLGITALTCFDEALTFDFDPSHIFLIGDYFQTLKGIVIPGVDDFEVWKTKLRTLYISIVRAIYPASIPGEYREFLQLLQTSTSRRDILDALDSWTLWRTSKRSSVIYKLESFVDTHSNAFYSRCDNNILSNWRASMNQDSHLRTLLSTFQRTNHHRPGCTPYNMREIDILLCFLRICVGYFEIKTKVELPGIFRNEFEFVEYLDSRVPVIMKSVYKGCVRCQNDDRLDFNFELESLY